MLLDHAYLPQCVLIDSTSDQSKGVRSFTSVLHTRPVGGLQTAGDPLPLESMGA